jgi:hypothetical protein
MKGADAWCEQHTMPIKWPLCTASCNLQSFDEMLLMKRGGRIIYFGPLGPCSCHMVQYFEVRPIARCSISFTCQV